jgi:hypothetical protein
LLSQRDRCRRLGRRAPAARSAGRACGGHPAARVTTPWCAR